MLKNCTAIFVLFLILLSRCSKLPLPTTLDASTRISASDGAFSDYVNVEWKAVSGAKKYYIYRTDAVDGAYSKIGSSASESYKDYNVELQHSYFYKVTAIGYDSSEGKPSSVDSGYADVFPSIYNLSATNGSSSEIISLTWNMDQKGSVSYRVYRSETADGTYTVIAEPSSLNYDDTSAERGKPYFYKVQGISKNGNIGELSNDDSGYTSLPAPVLSASKGTSTSEIVLSWTTVSLAASYSLSRSDSKSGIYTVLYTGSSASYTDSSASVNGSNASTDYYYQVTAISSYNLSGFTSNTDSGYVSLSSPSVLQATDGTLFNMVGLTWPCVENAVSYNIYRCVSVGSYSQIGSSTATEYQDSAVSFGTVYVYKVVAVKNGHETSFSPEDSGYMKDPSIKSKFTVSWAANRNKGVNRTGGGYKVYYSKDSSFASSLTTTVPYVSGDYAPLSAILEFDYTQTGKWYVKVSAYAYFGSIKESSASSITEITVK